MAKKSNNKEQSFEQTLWQAADKLRKNIDAAEYKHIVLGLIFLKYISDAFEEKREQLDFEFSNPDSEWYIRETQERYMAMEDPEEYRAENIFFVPEKARWSYLQSVAKQPEIGLYVDEAMIALEKENPILRDVLPKVYARQNLDKQSLGGLIDLIGTIVLGDVKARSQDVLGRVYEYFLGEFALAEGKKGGQFYTPASIVKLLVAMIEPYEGRVFDPCCGSGGMFVQSEKFVEAHADHYNSGKKNGLPLKPKDRISIYGQESNQTTWRLCKMNLAIRGIDASNIRWNNEGSFLKDGHPDLKADFILANPPFNASDWSGDLLRADGRWKFGTPPVNNANFAWVQHFIYQKSSAKLFPAYSLLMTSRATVGEIAINTQQACTNQGFITLIPNNNFSLYFLHGWLKTQLKQVRNLASGSTFPEISKSVFRNFDIIVPEQRIMGSYLNVAKPLYQKIENNTYQLQTLTRLRDTLLPKLMSGKIQVNIRRNT